MKDIKFRQLGFFFLAFLPVSKIFFLPSAYARVSGSDMWISALINVFFDLLTLIAVIYVWRRFEGKSLYDIIADGAGAAAAKVVFAIYFVYFFVKAYIPFLEQKNFVEQTLYENTANPLMFMPIFAFAAYLSIKKTATLGRVADMLMPITVVGLILVFSMSLNNTDFGAILPVGVNGFGNILRSAYYAVPWYGDAVYMLFMLGELLPEKKYAAKTLVGYIFACAAVVFFMVLFYGTFSSIAVRQNFALTEISKYSSVINNIGRFDYLGIFCILLSAIFALCLPLYFATYCFKKFFGIKKGLWPSIGVCAAMCIVIALTVESFAAVQGFIQKYLSGFLFIVGNITPALILFTRRKNVEKTSES